MGVKCFPRSDVEKGVALRACRTAHLFLAVLAEYIVEGVSISDIHFQISFQVVEVFREKLEIPVRFNFGSSVIILTFLFSAKRVKLLKTLKETHSAIYSLILYGYDGPDSYALGLLNRKPALL